MNMSLPAILLRGEGATLLVAATVLYWDTGGSWLLFALLILAPDLSMFGYIAGPRIGAIVYNLLHTLMLAVPVAVLGAVADQDWMLSVGLILVAHIGLDRLIGYGLKYPDGFKATHLARV